MRCEQEPIWQDQHAGTTPRPFKPKATLAAIKGEKTLRNWHSNSTSMPTRSSRSRAQLLEGATGVFETEPKAEPAAPTIDVTTLHAKIGELRLVNNFLEGALGTAGLLSAKR